MLSRIPLRIAMPRVPQPRIVRVIGFSWWWSWGVVPFGTWRVVIFASWVVMVIWVSIELVFVESDNGLCAYVD